MFDNFKILNFFLNNNVSARHPYFLTLVEEQSEHFTNSAKSTTSLNANLTDDALVKQEANFNCHDNRCSQFLCILGLSSAINHNIYTY